MTPTAPDLSTAVLPFLPASYWRAGEYDAAALNVALKAQPGLADFVDDLGNVQSAVWIDLDADPANIGWWVTIPADVAQSEIDAAIAAYTPPPPPSTVATAADHAAASAALVTAQLAAVPIPRDQIETILQALLGEAASAIPFFEKYALDPSMTGKQWTDFQALDQATKDRLLYDTLRTLAALLRYLTGDLPAS